VYNRTLSYLIKGITCLTNYDLFITNSESEFCINSIKIIFFHCISACNLQGYSFIRNKQQQEYESIH